MLTHRAVGGERIVWKSVFGLWIAFACIASSAFSSPASTSSSSSSFGKDGIQKMKDDFLFRNKLPFDDKTGRTLKVAVIGTTGKLGREAIRLLSERGIATKCLLRHKLLDPQKHLRQKQQQGSATTVSSFSHQNEEARRIATELEALPGVEMVLGDVTNATSLHELLRDTTVCLALYGAQAPKPFFKALFPLSIFFHRENDNARHPKQVNYKGVENILRVMSSSSATCKHLVRITGKGEQPWSIVSILINALSGNAKGWNYEAEQLIRTTAAKKDSGVTYTIIRPGLMQTALKDRPPQNEEPNSKSLCIADNGRDLPVTAVTYCQIADLAIQVATNPLHLQHCPGATLTAMNYPLSPAVSTTFNNTLGHVRPDTRHFPATLIRQHQLASRVGGLVILSLLTVLLTLVTSLLAKVLTWIVPFVLSRFSS